MLPPLACAASVFTELFVAVKLWPASIKMLPALAGPVLLAAIDEPPVKETDCAAVSEIVPPGPESVSIPTVRLKMPAGLPSVNVPEMEAVPVLIEILPPVPLLLVPLSIRAPLPMVNNPVEIEMLPALPHRPEQWPPIVFVKMPLG